MQGTLDFAEIERLLRQRIGDIQGTDSEDRVYESIVDLWKFELADKLRNPKNAMPAEWYTKALNYWDSEENCPITDDGVLGGYGALTPMDSLHSNLFLDALKVKFPSLTFGRVADCGAGIGRVTKSLLLHRFQHVDLVEQSPRLIHAAPNYIGDIGKDRVSLICEGLQDFAPAPDTYDMIWMQWVIGHLHDLDFITFFQRCQRGLKPGGIIVLKDNCCEDWTFVVDKQDSSVSRCPQYYYLLFELAGLRVVHEVLQPDFPSDLYPVRMFALMPK